MQRVQNVRDLLVLLAEVAYFTGEGLIPDLSGLLSGKIEMKLERKVIAASAIAEAETLLSIDEFNELFC